MVNAYLLYKRKREMHGKKVMSHYDFRKKIVLAKIFPCKYGAAKQKMSVAVQREDKQAIRHGIPSKRVEKEKRKSPPEQAETRTKRAKVTLAPYLTSGAAMEAATGGWMERLNHEMTHFPLPIKGDTKRLVNAALLFLGCG